MANKKLKLLYLAQYLHQETDEQHPKTLQDLLAHLERCGISAERKSIYDDIHLLQDFGMEIQTTKGKSFGYFLGERDFQLPELKLPREGMHPTGFIVICHDLRVNANPTPFLKDVGIVAQTILLAATEKGFGGCMIGSYKADALRIELGLVEELVPQLVIALGKPAEEVRIAQVGADGDTVYYRDENDVHYVPKRSLEDILL